jgi:PAS domain-containing protein
MPTDRTDETDGAETDGMSSEDVRPAAERTETAWLRRACRVLMDETDGSTLLCDADGTILLHEASAADLFGASAPHDAGRPETAERALEGRSLNEWVDDRTMASLLRAAPPDDPLDPFEAERTDATDPAHVVSVGERWLRLSARPVRRPSRCASTESRPSNPSPSLVLVTAEDRSSVGHAEAEESPLLRDLIGSMRAPLASIRAAIETMTAYAPMDRAAADPFKQIIQEEAVALSEKLEAAAAAYGRSYLRARPFENLRIRDVLDHVARAMNERLKVSVERKEGETASGASSDSGVHVDLATLREVMVFLGARIENAVRPGLLRLTVERRDRVVVLDLSWEGRPVTPDRLRRWMDEPRRWADGRIEAPLARLIDHQDAQVWAERPSDSTARLRLLLPDRKNFSET